MAIEAARDAASMAALKATWSISEFLFGGESIAPKSPVVTPWDSLHMIPKAASTRSSDLWQVAGTWGVVLAQMAVRRLR